MDDLIKLKVILHLMKLRVLLYGWLCFSDMRPTSLLKATVVDGTQPPLVDRTRGVKVPCSTLRTCCLYALLFSHSCLLQQASVEDVQFAGSWEFEDSDIKGDCLIFSRKFWALMSSLAPSSVLVLLRGNLNPVNSWRVGSTQMFRHTSLRRCAVLSLIALCRMQDMAPFRQLNAWLTLNGWQHGQCVASLVGVQPNLRQRHL